MYAKQIENRQKKILKLKELLNGKCRSAFKKDIQMFVFF